MDGRNLEPRDGLFQDQPWLQALLRRENSEPVKAMGNSELPQWV